VCTWVSDIICNFLVSKFQVDQMKSYLGKKLSDLIISNKCNSMEPWIVQSTLDFNIIIQLKRNTY
jgi:hypothetical protein